jgi:hypothetical protein
MLTSLTTTKKIGKQAQSQPTLVGILKLLAAQGFAWERIELSFQAGGAKGNSIKSLKAIAKQNDFLQPHYRQKYHDRTAAGATGGWPLMWKTQTFAEALADKDKKRVVVPSIQWTLPGKDGSAQEILAAVDTILAEYPQKNYRYDFHAQFIGLNFGEGTLSELPEEYLKGPGPFKKDGANGTLRGVKWAFSQVRLGKDKYGSSIVTHCLLNEGTEGLEKQHSLPEPFVGLVKSLHALKPKEVMRRVIQSVQESDDHYAKLTTEQRAKLDSEIFSYVIGQELVLYHKTAGHEFPEPRPATGDSKELYAYFVKVSYAINEANRQTVRIYNPGKIRQMAAKAVLEGTFTSIDALELDPPVDEKLVAFGQRYDELIADAAKTSKQALDASLAEGKLPHRLERYYFPEGILRQVGQTEDGKVILASFPNPHPDKTTYVPYHQLWVPEDRPIPPSLQAVGYQRDTTRAQFQVLNQLFLQTYNNPVHALGHFKKTIIDGIECIVVTTDREKINRRKILGDVFKPLGYAFVKQPQGSIGSYELRKPLSETESLLCDFDFGTWRQTIDCTFAYDWVNEHSPKLKRFRICLTGWAYPGTVAITSEELFAKTIENIAAMAALVEKEVIAGLRKSLDELRHIG